MVRWVAGFISHSTISVTRKEGNILFNDALNTFYLRLYDVRHMVKDHSDSERGNPLPLYGLHISINSKGSFICIIPQTGYYIPRPLLHQSWSTGWNEKKLNGSTPWRIDPTTHRTVSERFYHGATSRSRGRKGVVWRQWFFSLLCWWWWFVSSQCSTTVANAVVCVIMMHIKDALLLIEKNSPCTGSRGFLSHYLNGPLP